MTIAACYLSREGVVLGADSTTTMLVVEQRHHFNFAQKVFQIGSESTLGITTWGLGSLRLLSYRTAIAEFADNLDTDKPKNMREIASRWSQFFWDKFSTENSAELQHAQTLAAQSNRKEDEENELQSLVEKFSGGFCIGGYYLPNRTPEAFEISYGPEMVTPPSPQQQSVDTTRFWGCPNLVNRLIVGVDEGILRAILQSGKWQGRAEDLFDIVKRHMLVRPGWLPIREAIDWVHASIYATIKAIKFSHLAPVCGGPIEVAVITTDRPFRWVRHKVFGAAIEEGDRAYG